MIFFHYGKTKIRVVTKEWIATPPDTSPLYAEGVHMLDGHVDEEMDHFLKE